MKTSIGKLPSITILLVTLTPSLAGFSQPGWGAQRSAAQTRAVTQSASPGWVQTGSLITARSLHTATLLPNGKVLVVGGRGTDSTGLLDSAELYDPATGTWAATGRMTVPRNTHTATLLANGQVLVVGGDYGQGAPPFGLVGTAELYDPANGTWSQTGRLNTARGGFSATLLQNGKVLVAGGADNTSRGNELASAELYDPGTGTWSATGNLHIARDSHTATRLQDGRVLVARGTDAGMLETTLPSAELYDPVSGEWSVVGSASWGSVLHTATLLPNGKVLVAGGDNGGIGGDLVLADSEQFDPASLSWSRTGDLIARRFGHAATLLPSGEVLISGGDDEIGGRVPKTLASTERFDPSAMTWSSATSLNVARNYHTATLLGDGRVLVAGGSTATEIALASAELYVADAAPPGTIGPGFTGSWYDPTQSGHGLFIEVLPDNRFYATWFAFNPAGTEQAWFTGVGTYGGNTATIADVEQPTGGRWIPNFDPAQIVRNLWGTLTFTFTDCNHGRVDFNSVAGYGTGSMNLTRLTQPAGLTCP